MYLVRSIGGWLYKLLIEFHDLVLGIEKKSIPISRYIQGSLGLILIIFAFYMGEGKEQK